MLKDRSAIGIVCIGIMLMLAGGISYAGVLEDKVWSVADRLERTQIKDQDSLRNGSWANQDEFTGAIASGLAAAFRVTSEERFETAAEMAGLHVVYLSQSYTGDEALALANLAVSSPFYPATGFWKNILLGYYSHIQNTQEVADYLNSYSGDDSYWSIFDVANHVVAVYKVNAQGKEEWRKGLINWIKRLDDEQAHYPVMALGIATWALAQSGPLDGTLIDPNGEGSALWRGKSLSDLPGLLLSHQVPTGDPGAGSFYWRFDHGDGVQSGQGKIVQGYTEDAIYGTLGLWAAHQADPNSQELTAAVAAAQNAILGGVQSDGSVCEHLSDERAKVYDVMAGEMAQVLATLAISQYQ